MTHRKLNNGSGILLFRSKDKRRRLKVDIYRWFSGGHHSRLSTLYRGSKTPTDKRDHHMIRKIPKASVAFGFYLHITLHYIHSPRGIYVAVGLDVASPPNHASQSAQSSDQRYIYLYIRVVTYIKGIEFSVIFISASPLDLLQEGRIMVSCSDLTLLT